MNHPLDLPQPYMELVTMTPELAERLLRRNDNNRRISPSTVRIYANSMREGLWRNPTPEALAIDRDGQLIQGQHRLLALVSAGVTLQFWINYNADPEDYHVLDRGKKRSISDVLAMEGLVSSNHHAAIARAALQLRCPSSFAWQSRRELVTPDAVIEFSLDNQELIGLAVRNAVQAYSEAKIPATPYGALLVDVALKSPSLRLWDEWHDEVVWGGGIFPGDAAHALRRWATSLRTGKKIGTGGASTEHRVACVVKAWNARVEGRRVSQLKFTSAESFPVSLPSRDAVR